LDIIQIQNWDIPERVRVHLSFICRSYYFLIKLYKKGCNKNKFAQEVHYDSEKRKILGLLILKYRASNT